MTVLLLRDPIQSAVYYIGEILLFRLVQADLASLANQNFQRMFTGTSYDITRAYVRYRSGTLTVPCSGAIFDQVNQTGNQLFGVSFAPSFGPNISVGFSPVAPAGPVPLYTFEPFLTLSNASASACHADIFIFGHDVT